MKKSTILIVVGVIVQIIVFLNTKNTILSLCSGISGVIAVVKCSEKNILFYFWSIIQLITYGVICYQTQLYGKLFETVVYFGFLIFGVFTWKKHLNGKTVQVQKLDSYVGINTLIFFFVIILYPILYYLNDPYPLLDSSTVVIGISAQLLMVLRIKECWYYWIIQDILCIILWVILNNWCMVAQYSFWIINSIYGLKLWKNEKII